MTFKLGELPRLVGLEIGGVFVPPKIHVELNHILSLVLVLDNVLVLASIPDVVEVHDCWRLHRHSALAPLDNRLELRLCRLEQSSSVLLLYHPFNFWLIRDG